MPVLSSPAVVVVVCIFQIIGSVCYRSSSPELNIVPSFDEYLILQKTRQAWPDDISAVRINTLRLPLFFNIQKISLDRHFGLTPSD